MKIAVAYDNGNVFQHFGKSEMFKIYDVEDGQIVSGEVMDSNGVGHEALAGLLAEQGVRVVICGGMGAGGTVQSGAQSGWQIITTRMAANECDILLLDKERYEFLLAGGYLKPMEPVEALLARAAG